MQLRETEFFQQYTAVVTGTMLLVMTFAFVSIPLTVKLPTGSLGGGVRTLLM